STLEVQKERIFKEEKSSRGYGTSTPCYGHSSTSSSTKRDLVAKVVLRCCVSGATLQKFSKDFL
ncbi:hypothetical protein PanWU01x14_232540, partial [Parasponia andersonii]